MEKNKECKGDCKKIDDFKVQVARELHNDSNMLFICGMGGIISTLIVYGAAIMHRWLGVGVCGVAMAFFFIFVYKGKGKVQYLEKKYGIGKHDGKKGF